MMTEVRVKGEVNSDLLSPYTLDLSFRPRLRKTKSVYFA